MFDWTLVAILWVAGAFFTFWAAGAYIVTGQMFVGWRPWKVLLAFIGLIVAGPLPWLAVCGALVVGGIRWLLRNEPLA